MNTSRLLCCIPLLCCIACSSEREFDTAQTVITGKSELARQAPRQPVSVEFLEKILQNNRSIVSEAHRQIILVSNETRGAVPLLIRTFEKQSGVWRTRFPEMNANGARNGFAPFDAKEEGDARAPTGIFSISAAFGYRESVDTLMPYRQATNRDFWIDDAASDSYNQWVRLAGGEQPDVSNERMKRDDNLYEYGMIIDYNVNPIVKGKGSAIFIHAERAPGAPTAGCISTSIDNLLTLLKWLDPSRSPLIIMGTHDELRSASFLL